MDILTHAISGTAVATTAATFVKVKPLGRAKILLAGTLGGVFPDIDAVSMWSRFNGTFGKIFGLSHSGREIYGMKLWYSHHAFFHSLLASILFGLLLLGIIYLIKKRKKNRISNSLTPSFLSSHIIYFVAFVLGYWAHLVGDLPTPASVWGGIAFLWPSQEYIGGYGKIWWWNNYDIFLLILSSIALILLVPLLSKYIRSRAKIFSVLILSITLSLTVIQINTREFDYAYENNTTRYAEMEQNSKKEQERILGKRLYGYMMWFDSKMKFHF